MDGIDRSFSLHGYRENEKEKAFSMEVDAKREVACLANRMKDRGIFDRRNRKISAGYTYFGQFISHDISYFKNLYPAVSPSLNLHVLYGMGPQYSSFLYQLPNTAEKTDFELVKLAIWKNKKLRNSAQRLRYDVPRCLGSQIPLMGDTRNDENFIISQLHVKFCQFHNHCVERVLGATKSSKEEKKSSGLFQKTRNLFVIYYHLIVLQDYLPKLVSKKLIEDLLECESNFKFFPLSHEVALREEFTEAVFRIGHSQVRNGYQLTEELEEVLLFSNSEKVNLSGFKRDLRRDINWLYFFDKENTKGIAASLSNKIDPNIGEELYELPCGTNLVKTNIERSLENNLNAQALIKKIGPTYKMKEHFEEPLLSELLKCYPSAKGNIYDLPLWVFILIEAKIEENGLKLGQIGERVIAEQIILILRLSKNFKLLKELYKGFSTRFNVRDIVFWETELHDNEKVDRNINIILNNPKFKYHA